jgi:hypothetical protein
MKKFIALLLAILMTFSVATVAFAADATTAPETETTTPVEGTEGEDNALGVDLGEFSWILDLPLWTAKPLLKIAKIALKFVKVYFKLSELVGNIPDGVADQLEQIIKDTIAKAEQDSAEPETTTAAAIA